MLCPPSYRLCRLFLVTQRAKAKSLISCAKTAKAVGIGRRTCLRNARKDDHDMHADDAPAGRCSRSGSIKSVSEANVDVNDNENREAPSLGMSD